MGVAVAAEPAVNRCNGFPEPASNGSSVETVETVERHHPRPGTPMNGGVNETREEFCLTPPASSAIGLRFSDGLRGHGPIVLAPPPPHKPVISGAP